jgi:hypothetical protein
MELRIVPLLTIQISINECGKGSSTRILKTSLYEKPFDDTQINSFDFSVVDSIFYVIIFEVEWSFLSLLFKMKKNNRSILSYIEVEPSHPTTRWRERESEERKKEKKLTETIAKDMLTFNIKFRLDVFLFYSWKT